MRVEAMEELNEAFLKEYNSVEAVRKYSTGTAGHGINYLLQHDYAHVYLDALKICMLTAPEASVRLLEFGCGVGMNLFALLSLLERKQIPVEVAIGTDFSEPLIESARREAQALRRDGDPGKTSFHVARNERLAEDLAVATGHPLSSLQGSFDLIVGVNTFRYCHRLRKEADCGKGIHTLLRPGGVCVVIDMNDRFPLFRSRLKRSFEPSEECYIPSLDEYASPLREAGLELIVKKHFCWIPHSAGPVVTVVGRTLTPLLNMVAQRFAMRSLVIAKRPVAPVR